MRGAGEGYFSPCRPLTLSTFERPAPRPSPLTTGGEGASGLADQGGGLAVLPCCPVQVFSPRRSRVAVVQRGMLSFVARNGI